MKGPSTVQSSIDEWLMEEKNQGVFTRNCSGRICIIDGGIENCVYNLAQSPSLDYLKFFLSAM